MAKVLVIDDDANLLNLLRIFLTKMGWTTPVAKTGAEGLRLAREEKPDIILCDVNLPDLDGLQIARNLRAMPECARTPLVLITGARKEAESVIAGLDGGAQGYLLKPVDLRLVHAKLEAVLKAGK